MSLKPQQKFHRTSLTSRSRDDLTEQPSMRPHQASSDWSSTCPSSQRPGALGARGPEGVPQQLVQVVCVLVPGGARPRPRPRPARSEGLEVGRGRGVGEGSVQLAQRQPEGVRVHLDQVTEHAGGGRGGGITICEPV